MGRRYVKPFHADVPQVSRTFPVKTVVLGDSFADVRHVNFLHALSLQPVERRQSQGGTQVIIVA